MISWTTNEVIHRIVKRDVPESDRGTIPTLNDLPDWMVEEARQIARESLVGAGKYLKFYVSAPYADWADDFIQDVLLDGGDARTWNVHDCLCIPDELTSTTALEVHYRDLFQGMDSERWFRIKPKSADQHSAASPGAVGILSREVRYWHAAPKGLAFFRVQAQDVEFVEPAMLDIAMRRWIAHRMSWWARKHLELHRAGTTGDEIIRAIPGADASKLTDDARIAAGALAREARAYGETAEFPQRAGFLGIDSWYQ